MLSIAEVKLGIATRLRNLDICIESHNNGSDMEWFIAGEKCDVWVGNGANDLKFDAIIYGRDSEFLVEHNDTTHGTIGVCSAKKKFHKTEDGIGQFLEWVAQSLNSIPTISQLIIPKTTPPEFIPFHVSGSAYSEVAAVPRPEIRLAHGLIEQIFVFDMSHLDGREVYIGPPPNPSSQILFHVQIQWVGRPYQISHIETDGKSYYHSWHRVQPDRYIIIDKPPFAQITKSDKELIDYAISLWMSRYVDNTK